jgi:hypothetical protein
VTLNFGHYAHNTSQSNYHIYKCVILKQNFNLKLEIGKIKICSNFLFLHGQYMTIFRIDYRYSLLRNIPWSLCLNSQEKAFEQWEKIEINTIKLISVQGPRSLALGPSTKV